MIIATSSANLRAAERIGGDKVATGYKFDEAKAVETHMHADEDSDGHVTQNELHGYVRKYDTNNLPDAMLKVSPVLCLGMLMP